MSNVHRFRIDHEMFEKTQARILQRIPRTMFFCWFIYMLFVLMLLFYFPRFNFIRGPLFIEGGIWFCINLILFFMGREKRHESWMLVISAIPSVIFFWVYIQVYPGLYVFGEVRTILEVQSILIGMLIFPFVFLPTLPLGISLLYGLSFLMIFLFTVPSSTLIILNPYFQFTDLMPVSVIYLSALATVSLLRHDRSFEYKELLRKNIVTVRQNEEVRSQSEQYYYQAYYDFLTGLYNRAAMELKIFDAISLAQDEGSSLTVFFMDMDNFKRINDQFGHRVGDSALIAVARRFRQLLFEKQLGTHMPQDERKAFLARLSGDEFVTVIVGISEAEAKKICRTLVRSCAMPYNLPNVSSNEHPKISISVGAIRMRFYGDKVYNRRLKKVFIRQAVLKESDKMMYIAKKKKNTFVYLDL